MTVPMDYSWAKVLIDGIYDFKAFIEGCALIDFESMSFDDLNIYTIAAAHLLNSNPY